MSGQMLVTELVIFHNLKEFMTDLILKSFNEVALRKSYGGKTLQENLANADVVSLN